MKKNSESFTFSSLAINVWKVDRHNSKWLYYSSMRHSRFCSPESALQNPMNRIQNAVIKSCLKRDTTLWTTTDTKKGRSSASISSKFNLFELKIAAQTYFNGRSCIAHSKTNSNFISVSLGASEDQPRRGSFSDLSIYRTNGMQLGLNIKVLS